MNAKREVHDPNEVREVKYVQFGVFSPDEIKAMSITPEGINIRNILKDGKPIAGGLMDPRQGPMDRFGQCKTCSNNIVDCPGHFGHIELAQPIYHVLVDRTSEKVQAIQAKYKTNPRKRLAAMHSLCHGIKTCTNELKDEPRNPLMLPRYKRTKRQEMELRDHGSVFIYNRGHYNEELEIGALRCNKRQPTVVRKGLEIHVSFSDSMDGYITSLIVLTPHQVRDILSHISDEDAVLLGTSPRFARPEWMVLTVLPVSPICVRPAVLISGYMQRSHDDLTHKLGDIVLANNMLRKLITTGSADHEVLEASKLLQYHVATMMDNDLQYLPRSVQRTGRPIKSLKDRLKGKEGRLRGNLMGKRVDFSGRTVITPDPNLGINEVGVPKTIAKVLTFPEIVAPYNISRLQKLVMRGDEYPGARSIIRNDGMRVDLQSRLQHGGVKLELGMKVERHLQEHDIVIFNRQPTLHKMSMMGHRVRVLPFSTFRMNLSCTSPYNADFDGDEMNLHVPQSQEVVAEIDQLELVSRQTITPQSSRPVMGIVQDSLLGVCLLTQRDCFVDINVFMHLMMQMPHYGGLIVRPCILKPAELWSGKQVFSKIIPGQLNMTRTHATHPDEEDENHNRWISLGDTRVIVENSVLIMGILCKRTLGASMGSLLHIATTELGQRVAAELYSTIQRVVNCWLEFNGHSIGIADCIADIHTYSCIESNISRAKQMVLNVISEAKRVSSVANITNESFESRVNQVLNQARDSTGDLAKHSLRAHNNLKLMVIAGSKGSNINVSQVIACVGQQNVEGKRIPWGFKTRSLPHFHKCDYEPESRGFVENSYLTGLTPAEFYFHAMGGREGLIDTAVKTAETGYIQRRLIKAMESTMVQYDGTVRDSCGNIIQFCYGEDGLCGEAVEFQQLPTLKLTHEDFRKKFKMDISDRSKLFRIFSEDTVEQLDKNADAVNTLEAEWCQLCADREQLREIFPLGDARVVLPCNLDRMVYNVQKTFKISNQSLSTLQPHEAVLRLNKLISEIVVVSGEDEFSKRSNHDATLLFQCLMRSTLCSRMVTERHRLSSESFDTLLAKIRVRFEHSIVSPGEMVGALAAQCIGEPATQMTLNTFHFAGVSAKNVTLGVPRLKEILNASKHPSSPSMTVYLLGEAASDPAVAKRVMTSMEHTRLQDVTSFTHLLYDPDPMCSRMVEDNEFLTCYYELVEEHEGICSPWVLRLLIDRKRMTDTGIHMEYIAERINSAFGDDLRCVFSDDNVEQPIIRLCTMKRPPSIVDAAGNEELPTEVEEEDSHEKSIEDYAFIRSLEATVLSDMSLHGLKAVKKVYMHLPLMSNKKRTYISERGDFQQVSEWLLETEGSALGLVLGDRNVCRHRTYTNDINEINNVLGVEAVRRSIEKEINCVMSFYGLYVNYRHLALLCDVMTARGHVMAITRHGLNRQHTGALMRASFEETLNVLLDAATHGERDELAGVSEKLVLGQMIPYGTGCFDVICDVKKCKQPVKSFEKLLNSVRARSVEQSTTWSPSFPRSPRSPKSRILRNANTLYRSSLLSELPQFSPTISDSRSPIFKSPMAPDIVRSSIPRPPYAPSPIPSIAGAPCYSAKLTTLSRLPTSPLYNPTTPIYSPCSFQPYSPLYKMISPSTTATSRTSPLYNPHSPLYSPTSPSTSYVMSQSNSSYLSTIRSYSPISTTPSSILPSYSSAKSSYSLTSSSNYPRYTPSTPAITQYSPESPDLSDSEIISPISNKTYGSFASPLFSDELFPANQSPTISEEYSVEYSPSCPTYMSTKSPFTDRRYSPDSPAYSPTTPSYVAQSNNSDITLSMTPSTLSSYCYSPSDPGMHIRYDGFESSSKKSSQTSLAGYSITPTTPSSLSSVPGLSPLSPIKSHSYLYTPGNTSYSPTSPGMYSDENLGEYSPTSPAYSENSDLVDDPDD